jgi:hypothetical protein
LTPIAYHIITPYILLIQPTSPETTILNVLQLLWTTLPPTLKSHRARYNIKSLFSLDDRDRPGYLVWKTRHLADLSQQDVLRDNKSEDEHG